jgi:hypothetical protein
MPASRRRREDYSRGDDRRRQEREKDDEITAVVAFSADLRGYERKYILSLGQRQIVLTHLVQILEHKYGLKEISLARAVEQRVRPLFVWAEFGDKLQYDKRLYGVHCALKNLLTNDKHAVSRKDKLVVEMYKRGHDQFFAHTTVCPPEMDLATVPALLAREFGFTLNDRGEIENPQAASGGSLPGAAAAADAVMGGSGNAANGEDAAVAAHVPSSSTKDSAAAATAPTASSSTPPNDGVSVPAMADRAGDAAGPARGGDAHAVVLIYRPAECGSGLGISTLKNPTAADMVRALEYGRAEAMKLKHRASNVLVSRYIGDLALWHGRKFHMRAYYLVTIVRGVVRAYLWERGDILAAAKPFVLDDFANKDIHDTHFDSTGGDFAFPRDLVGPHGLTSEVYAAAWASMSAAMRHVSEILAPHAKSFEESVHAFEVFGVDFLLRADGSAILLEV